MEQEKRSLSRLRSKLSRFKYPLLILLLGAFFLLLPGKESRTDKIEETAPVESAEQPDCEARLEEILSQVQGAGKVRVMLTVRSGPETVYQQDTRLDTDSQEGSEGIREENATVLISRGGGTEEPVVSQVLGPDYCGAIVVCQGADNPQVKLSVVQAVCSVTGLGADQVTVLKMK